MHTGNKGYFRRFTGGQQALVEGSDQRIVAGSHQRCHVQGGADWRPSTADAAAASEGATIPIHRRYAHQGPYSSPTEGAYLWEVA